jgi:putative chitinase
MLITEQEVRLFAPKAKNAYVKVLTSEYAVQWMKYCGITNTRKRMCGFFANGGHETGGMTVIRESLNYTTINRLRQVWPKRFGNKSDAELRPLIRNERALAAKVYMGRMGNKTPEDAYFFRGSGWLQTTGRYSYIKHGTKIKIDFIRNPEKTDDMAVMFALACLEWADSGCNAQMDRDDFLATCSLINVGSSSAAAKRAIVGKRDREIWFNRALNVFSTDDVRDISKLSMEGFMPASISEDYDDIEGGNIPGQESHWTDVDDLFENDPIEVALRERGWYN